MATASTTVPVKGENSPEYMAIRSKCSDLIAVLDDPVNKSRAAKKLFEANMITTMLSENTSGESMVSSVLQGIKVNAMKFYEFLAVLQALSNHKDILERIHKAFLRKSIYYAQHTEKLTTSAFTDAVKQKIPSDTYKDCSVECKYRLYTSLQGPSYSPRPTHFTCISILNKLKSTSKQNHSDIITSKCQPNHHHCFCEPGFLIGT